MTTLSASPLRRAFAGVLALAVLGCQPVDTEPTGTVTPTEAGAAGPRVGAPTAGVPADVAAVLAELGSTAESWVPEARPVEVVLSLDDDGTPTDVRVTYLAPDADRLLLVRVSGDGTSQERPTLEGLALEPVPEQAFAQIPDFPDGPEPDQLVAVSEQALDECGVDEVEVVLYATGAPASWDGQAWTEPPEWTATLSGDGAAAVVDPRTGALVAPGCV